MSTNESDDARGTISAADQPEYGEIRPSDEVLVIYDRENHRAWLQSSVAVSIEDCR